MDHKRNTTQFVASAIIDASKEDVWNVLKPFGNISAFHPLVKVSYSTNDTVGLGAKRHCKLLPMGAMDEEITRWNEEESFTATVVGGKMLPPCDQMYGTVSLQRVGDRTKVSFAFSYQMRFGWFGQMMNNVMIKPQFKKAPVKYVNGLKSYIEGMESRRR